MTASITVDGTTTYYATLADAAAAVSEGQTIVLLDDVTVAEGETLAFNAWAELDAGEHTITCSGTVTIGESDGIIFENALYYLGDATEKKTTTTVPTYFVAGNGYAIFRPDMENMDAVLILHDATLAPVFYQWVTGYEADFEFPGSLTIQFSGTNYLNDDGSGTHYARVLVVEGNAAIEGIGENAILNIVGGDYSLSLIHI